MKKIIVVLTLLVVVSSNSFAQGDFRFGFQTSPSFSWMNTNDNTINGNGSNLGLKLGLVGEKYFQENYGFTFGLNFAFNHGGTLKYQGTGTYWPKSITNPDFVVLPANADLKFGLQYLEIPVTFRMRTQEFGYVRYYLDIPSITLGILTQAKGDIEATRNINGTTETLNTVDEDIRKDVNFLTMSLGMGGGLEYSIGENISLIGGLAFQTSFIDITKDNDTSYTTPSDLPTAEKEDSKAKMNVLTIRIGVLF